VLASAVAKGDRQRVLLDMTTQLGIEAYVPLICERSAARPESHNVDRWTRVCVEACKQSHNPHLPDIRPIQTPAGFASTMKDAGVPIYMAYPQGDPKTPPCSVDRVAVCIGPEGGFSRREVSELIGAGAAPWSLGPNILRIETAAVAAVNRLQSHCRFD
jgi:16S rRNA (uracil1498-N3)-methyltransferase